MEFGVDGYKYVRVHDRTSEGSFQGNEGMWVEESVGEDLAEIGWSAEIMG